MTALFVAIALLIASVAAIYLLLKNMGQDGVEVAAPGSCKSGRCGVRKATTADASCQQEEDPYDESDDAKGLSALDRQPAQAEQQDSRVA